MSAASKGLEDRLLLFSKESVALCKELSRQPHLRPLALQLIRSATSMGANYSEAQNAISRNDFRAKVFICKKECQETVYWLNVLKDSVPPACQPLHLHMDTEANELIKIFQAITTKLSSSNPTP